MLRRRYRPDTRTTSGVSARSGKSPDERALFYRHYSIHIWVETVQEPERRSIMPRESFANRASANLLYILWDQKLCSVFETIAGALGEGSAPVVSAG